MRCVHVPVPVRARLFFGFILYIFSTISLRFMIVRWAPFNYHNFFFDGRGWGCWNRESHVDDKRDARVVVCVRVRVDVAFGLAQVCGDVGVDVFLFRLAVGNKKRTGILSTFSLFAALSWNSHFLWLSVLYGRECVLSTCCATPRACLLLRALRVGERERPVFSPLFLDRGASP